MSPFTFVFIVSLLTLAGCEKKESLPAVPITAAPVALENAAQPTGNPTPTSKGPAAPARPTDPGPGGLPAEALVGAVHPFMTQQLQVFIRETGRMPKDFGEFAGSRMDSVPRLPDGLKYVVDTTTAQVKVVRK